jgi:hypothetical protein
MTSSVEAASSRVRPLRSSFVRPVHTRRTIGFAAAVTARAAPTLLSPAIGRMMSAPWAMKSAVVASTCSALST